MQFFTGKNSWPPDRTAASEKRKRENPESPLDELGSKRVKAQNHVNGDTGSIIPAENDRYRRFSEESLHSPSSRNAPVTSTSLPSPPIHPDRLSSFTPRSHSENTKNKIYPLSPLSRSPEHNPDEIAAGEPNTPNPCYRNLVWKAESLNSTNESNKPKPLHINTARAISDLDPRSPGYASRGLASRDSRGATPSLHQDSRDEYRPSSIAPSRRQSETMQPPSGASVRLPRSESSPPKISTPGMPKVPMDPANADAKPAVPKSSTARISGALIDAKEASFPNAAAPSTPASLAQNFTNFAQSIVSTTGMNMKLESLKALESENVKESRRHEKHNVAFASLMDVTNSNSGAIQKARAKMEKQLEHCNANQGMIANTLEAYSIQPSVLPTKDVARNHDTATQYDDDVLQELAKLREDLQELRDRLRDQEAKAVRQKDLEKFAQKTVSLEDLESLSTKRELLTAVSKISATTSDLKNLEAKVSQLADVEKEHPLKLQEIQQAYDKQIRDLNGEISQLKNTGQQRFTSTQTKLAEVKESLGALKADPTTQTRLAELGQNLNSWKKNLSSLGEDCKQLESAQAHFKAFIHGDSDTDEVGLSTRVMNVMNDLSQAKSLIGQLQEKTKEIGVEATRESTAPDQLPTPVAGTSPLISRFPVPQQHLANLEEELSTTKNELTNIRDGHDIMAGDFDELRLQQTAQREDLVRLKVMLERQQLQSVRPGQMDSLATVPAPNSPRTARLPNPTKLDQDTSEKLENDLRALGVFTNSLQMRFDNLTTEDMARSVIHQMKQMYNEHPGHVQDRIRALELRQQKVDTYIFHNLEPRLVHFNNQMGGCAGLDALQRLSNQVQALDTNWKGTVAHIAQLRKDLTDGVTNVKSISTLYVQGPTVIAKMNGAIDTLRKGLEEAKAQNQELRDLVTTGPRKLQGDVHGLDREPYIGATDYSQKQAALRGSSAYVDLNEVFPRAREKANTPNGASAFHVPVSSMSSSRQESETSRRDQPRSASGSDSDAPISSMQERKRKRQSLPNIAHNEHEDDDDFRHHAAGKIRR